MSIHALALKQACTQMKLPYRPVDNSGVFLAVTIHGKELLFIANQMPLNSSMVAIIANDKGHTYSLLHKVIAMPQTLAFVDPAAKNLFQPFVKEKSLAEIIRTIESTFPYPLVIKKNSGCQGTNVFRIDNAKGAKQALTTIFDQHSIDYDSIALAQEHIAIAKEYRVTVLNRRIELIYLKDNSRAQFVGNLSPLHWEGAKAILQTDHALHQKIDHFIQPLFSALDLEYGGLDVAIDTDGKLWLLEINTHPAYDHLVKNEGEEVLVGLYRKVLGYLGKK